MSCSTSHAIPISELQPLTFRGVCARSTGTLSQARFAIDIYCHRNYRPELPLLRAETLSVVLSCKRSRQPG